jgi:hypothetical protein
MVYVVSNLQKPISQIEDEKLVFLHMKPKHKWHQRSTMTSTHIITRVGPLVNEIMIFKQMTNVLAH